jgi:epoxyqueuosine reductase
MISAYALGDDYHDVMKKQLRQFCRALEQHASDTKPDQRIYVDTAPVLEHALAESAGLGWLGKHSLSIDRHYGSWFMLGEVFTTADFAPDEATTAHCGSCTACLDVCPTQAIVAPMQVDARRCISWLTIEYKGMIPLALRPLMGYHLYGCDDCQSCCPWNRHAQAPERYILETRAENILPELAGLLRLDDAAFRQRFRKSPIRRTGRDAMVRNACVVAGNAADPLLAPLLSGLVEDAAPVVRAHAAWALPRTAPARDAALYLERLMHAISQESDAQVLPELHAACQQLRSMR